MGLFKFFGLEEGKNKEKSPHLKEEVFCQECRKYDENAGRYIGSCDLYEEEVIIPKTHKCRSYTEKRIVWEWQSIQNKHNDCKYFEKRVK